MRIRGRSTLEFRTPERAAPVRKRKNVDGKLLSTGESSELKEGLTDVAWGCNRRCNRVAYILHRELPRSTVFIQHSSRRKPNKRSRSLTLAFFLAQTLHALATMGLVRLFLLRLAAGPGRSGGVVKDCWLMMVQLV